MSLFRSDINNGVSVVIKRSRLVVMAIAVLLLTSRVPGENDLTIRWGHQNLTPTMDTVLGGVVDNNNAFYVTGSMKSPRADTRPGVMVPPDADPHSDVFVIKYDAQGVLQWSRKLGGPETERASGVVADGQDNIYVFGYTHGTIGQESQGLIDAFVAKYDAAGTSQWIWQLGTPAADVCTGVAVDNAGNLYIAGYTYEDFARPNKGKADMFIAAYDKNRALLWKDQIGTSADDRAAAIRIGNNNDIYVCGDTGGTLAERNYGKVDFVLARYDRSGKSTWLRQYGSKTSDSVQCMEIGEHGHLFLGGLTWGKLGEGRKQRGNGDAFLVAFTEAGEMLWRRQFGSRQFDKVWHMTRFLDGTGDVLVGGCQYVANSCQGFCRRYTPQGKRVWTQEFRNISPRGGTCGRAVGIDSANNCYHAGSTRADLFGVNNLTLNVYAIKFGEKESPVTERPPREYPGNAAPSSEHPK